jgi:elongation factor Tu
LDYGEAGDNVGILVRGLTREQINRGLIIAKPGSLTANSVIEANIYVLKTEEGGRVNPFSSGYRPQVRMHKHSFTLKLLTQQQISVSQKELK